MKISNIHSLILKKLPCLEIACMHSVQTWQRVLLHLVCRVKFGYPSSVVGSYQKRSQTGKHQYENHLRKMKKQVDLEDIKVIRRMSHKLTIKYLKFRQATWTSNHSENWLLFFGVTRLDIYIFIFLSIEQGFSPKRSLFSYSELSKSSPWYYLLIDANPFI